MAKTAFKYKENADGTAKITAELEFQLGQSLYWNRPGPYATEIATVIAIDWYFATDTKEPLVQYKIKTQSCGHVTLAAWKADERAMLFRTAEEAHIARG